MTSKATGRRRGRLDRDGEEIEDRIYNTKDFDRTLVLDDRTKLVAKKVTEFLKESGDRFQKTIVFCVDEEHAARMRQALDQRERGSRATRTTATSCASPAATRRARRSSATSSTRKRNIPCSSPPRGCSPPASMRRPAA